MSTAGAEERDVDSGRAWRGWRAVEGKGSPWSDPLRLWVADPDVCVRGGGRVPHVVGGSTETSVVSLNMLLSGRTVSDGLGDLAELVMEILYGSSYHACTVAHVTVAGWSGLWAVVWWCAWSKHVVWVVSIVSGRPVGDVIVIVAS
jgi:hypothetical protein